jgi:hypothetical protein
LAGVARERDTFITEVVEAEKDSEKRRKATRSETFAGRVWGPAREGRRVCSAAGTRWATTRAAAWRRARARRIDHDET